jgi:tetratricopeptide (TPR) repeat protein
MRKYVLFFFLISFGDIYISLAQQTNEEFKFAVYLYQKKNYDEAIYVLKNLLSQNISTRLYDSSNYLLGRTYYNLQQLQASIQYFDLITNNSPLQKEGVFFSAFNEAYLGFANNGIKKLDDLYLTDPRLIQLKTFEMAGMNLLLSDYEAFTALQNQLTDPTYEFILQKKNLDLYYLKLVSAKKKSPYVGGFMSAIIPGSGKIYAGKPGQGIYNFFITGILGLQTIEAYRKSGPQSFRFIAYGTLFSSFYLGNIWGSALSVKMKKDESIEGIHQQILFDLHIPLRTIFH